MLYPLSYGGAPNGDRTQQVSSQIAREISTRAGGLGWIGTIDDLMAAVRTVKQTVHERRAELFLSRQSRGITNRVWRTVPVVIVAGAGGIVPLPTMRWRPGERGGRFHFRRVGPPRPRRDRFLVACRANPWNSFARPVVVVGLVARRPEPAVN